MTIETHVFCAKHAISDAHCEALHLRVTQRLGLNNRRSILTVPINAPDTRKLQLIIREGEQHDLYQHVHDFFELYGMGPGSVQGMVAEVNKR